MEKSLAFLILFFLVPANAKYVHGLGDLSCGQEGQRRCTFLNREFWLQGSGGCDRGLKSIKGKCRQGRRNSLKDHPWITKTIKFQRELQADLPINQIGVLWIHNSYNNRNDGYTFPNHKYSLTDLLDLGARVFEVDPHFIGKRLRLCHGEYNHLGCSPLDRLYFNIIEEFNLWIRKKENQNEVVVLKIQDQSDGHKDLLEKPLNHHLKDLILRPSDLKTTRYPTLNEIRKAGKRVMILGGPFSYSFPQKGKRTKVKLFDGKFCQFKQDEEVLWKHDPTFDNGRSENWQSVNWDATRYFRFYNGEKETGKITPQLVRKLVECNITGLEIDMMSPAHAREFIWTWEKGEPKNWGQKKNCAVITKKGRWRSEDCQRKLPFACQDRNYKGLWKISRYRGSFHEGEKACPRGTTFAHPQNGWENARLYKNNSFTNAWINLKG
ncbi:MAG: lectin-like protein [Bdellovibrionota bacterium]|nr:lectin-like protein [Bdellovibrionota bacterium]